LPGNLAWLLLLPLAASGYWWSQVDAKTGDGFFLGFPCYWNIIAFYLYMLHPPVWGSAAVVIVFSVLTFVPTVYLYATRGGPFATLINAGSAVWFVLLGLSLFGGAAYSRRIALASLVYPAMYLGLSAIVTARRRVA
jgi:phosphatidylcholine synthase